MAEYENTVGAGDIEDLVELFRLLSDKTRLTILMLLANGERNVSSLCEELALPQPTVSHHLGLLRTSRVIANRRNGKQVFYGLNGRVDREALGMMIDVHQFTVQIKKKAAGSIEMPSESVLDAG
jgi:DNA-binding transcriptional ArsR family regulator